MNDLNVTINNTELRLKEYSGKRVVTLKEIDLVHGRPVGTARKRFNDNRSHFIDGEDFFKVKCSEVRPFFGQTLPNGFNPDADITLITESGYMMLVKSFTDDLAWSVQRQLVNSYFRTSSSSSWNELSPTLQTLINLELQQKEQSRAIEAVNQKVDNIRDVVALNSNGWREDCRRLLAKVAQARGGGGAYHEVNSEVFGYVDERARVSLDTRLTNKRRRMADEGVCKSRRDKLSKVDVIADDPKLIEIYIAIVKEMCVKHGVTVNQEV